MEIHLSEGRSTSSCVDLQRCVLASICTGQQQVLTVILASSFDAPLPPPCSLCDQQLSEYGWGPTHLQLNLPTHLQLNLDGSMIRMAVHDTVDAAMFALPVGAAVILQGEQPSQQAGRRYAAARAIKNMIKTGGGRRGCNRVVQLICSTVAPLSAE